MTLKELADRLAVLAKADPHAKVYFECFPDKTLTRCCYLQKRTGQAEGVYVVLGQ